MAADNEQAREAELKARIIGLDDMVDLAHRRTGRVVRAHCVTQLCEPPSVTGHKASDYG
jgi:hypothetical protein